MLLVPVTTLPYGLPVELLKTPFLYQETVEVFLVSAIIARSPAIRLKDEYKNEYVLPSVPSVP